MGLRELAPSQSLQGDTSAVELLLPQKLKSRIGKVLEENFIHDDTLFFLKMIILKLNSLGINASKALDIELVCKRKS